MNQFGKLFNRRVEGQIYAQPLYVSNVAIPGQGTHNVVYVATQHNAVYAFDADNPTASAPLWQVTLGPAVYYKEVSSNISPELGITATPAIDATTKTMYLVTYTSEGGTQVYRLHALDITTGQEKFNGPKVIQGSVKGTGPDNVGGIITFNPSNHLQRPAMLLLNGVLYIAFGSHADQRIWHGWVFAYSPSTLQQLGIYNTTPNGYGGSIWQSGQGLTADEQGFAYFMTGNGTSTTDGVNISEAFGKIQSGSSSLALADWFMVSNASSLNAADLDLGSAGPLHIPGTQVVLGGGKQGVLYVVNTANLGHTGTPLQMLNVCPPGVNAEVPTDIWGSPIYWSPASRMYLWCIADYLQAYDFVNGKLSTTRVDMGTVQAAPGVSGGILSVSSNGSQTGTGIVWAARNYNEDALAHTVEGELHAFDATNLSKELWNSKQNDARDDVGDFGKFNPPLIANGKVYLATFNGQLLVYGLLPAPPAEPDSYMINAGGSATGPFRADSGFSGGATVSSSGFVDVKAVANAAPQLVYRSARQGNFTYTLSSLKPGAAYVVRLHFAEFQATGIGQRLFNLVINGKQVLSNFDIFAAANGPHMAIDRVFTATADATGSVTLQFTNGSAGNAQVNGIEIAPIGSTSAVFLGVDTKTQGTWTSAYGINGYNVVGYAASYPSYATVVAAAPNLYTWSASTTDVRALKKLPPATDRIAATWYASTNFVVDVNLTDGAYHKVSLYLLDWDTSNLRVENIDVVDAITGIVLDSQSVSSFSSGKYLSWNLKGHVQFRLARMSDSDNSVLSGLFFDSPASVVGTGASFLKTDTVTQGNWKGVYGGGGYTVINDSQSFPTTVNLSASGQSPYTWNSTTTDPRGLQRATTGRIAACWFANTQFSILLNLADGLPHQVALYFLDWDNQQRALKVTVLDAVTKALLDTETVSSFASGKYLVWRLQGNIEIDITSTVPGPYANAVVSGVFLDGPASQAQVTFVGQDTASEGTWIGVYGADGYDVINGKVNYPAYALVSASEQQPYTWASSSTDPRALQNPAVPGGRLAACWFNTTGFTIDINLTDGAAHQVSLYFLDWDKNGRVEKVEQLDAASGAVLDTRQISSFTNGIYLIWKITGHVQIRITSTVPGPYANAVVSGIFFR